MNMNKKPTVKKINKCLRQCKQIGRNCQKLGHVTTAHEWEGMQLKLKNNAYGLSLLDHKISTLHPCQHVFRHPINSSGHMEMGPLFTVSSVRLVETGIEPGTCVTV